MKDGDKSKKALLAEVRALRRRVTRLEGEMGTRREETRYQSLVEALPDAIFRLDRDGIYLDFVPAEGFETLHPPEVFLGKSLHETMPTDVAEQAMHHIHQALAHNTRQRFEYELFVRGEQGYYEARFVPDEDDSVLVIIRDLTERKKVEEQLAAFFSQSLDGCFFMMLDEPVQWHDQVDKEEVLDYVFAHQRITKINDVLLSQYGTRADHLLGLTPDAFFAHDRAYARTLWAAFFDQGRLRVETEERKLDGTPMWIEGEYVCLYDERGRIKGHFGIQRDITARRQADAALRESEARLRYVVDHTPLVFWVLDREGLFTASEGRGLAALGLEPGEVVGRSVFEVYAGAPAILENTRRVLAGEEVEWVAKAAGAVFDAHYLPLFDEQGAVTGAIGVAVEVTERERLIEEFEAKNAELERFTYTVSHDLKSPLVTIKGFLGMLENDMAKGKDERIQEDIEHIQGAADKMQRLLNELLDLSRIGRLVNAPEPVSLTELARDAVEQVAGQIAERGVEVDIAPAMPTVVGDRVRLLEVMQNLIDNAVKYMGDQPYPRIVVQGRREAGRVVCSVQDNGIGIARPYHEKVFGLFERLNPASDGTGIGLALVKRIVEVHGGRIWVASEGEGHGATFYFMLPQPED